MFQIPFYSLIVFIYFLLFCFIDFLFELNFSSVVISALTEYSIQGTEIYCSLLPWFVTGYADAEGTFVISIQKSSTTRLGWQVKLIFEIGAANNLANRKLLESFKDFFGGGRVSLGGNQLYYTVTDLPTLLRVRNHFLNHSLESTKLIHFQMWSQVLDLIVTKEHLTLEGLLRIVAIKSHFPMGLSELLSNAFSDLPSITKPSFISSSLPLNPDWIAGFANGDGSFSLGYRKRSVFRQGATCEPSFFIGQHPRDRVLLERIIASLDCGSVYNIRENLLKLTIADLSTITNRVIPFFTDHLLYGAKALDFRDFSKGISIMNSKGHLTEAGLRQLKELYDNMNSNRTKFE